MKMKNKICKTKKRPEPKALGRLTSSEYYLGIQQGIRDAEKDGVK